PVPRRCHRIGTAALIRDGPRATWLASLGRRSFILWWLIKRDNHIPIAAHSQFGDLCVRYGQTGARKHNFFVARRIGCPDVVLGQIGVVGHAWFVPRASWNVVCSTVETPRRARGPLLRSPQMGPFRPWARGGEA